MEDFVTWTDTSAIRKQVLDYNDMVSRHTSIYSDSEDITQYKGKFRELHIMESTVLHFRETILI